METNHQTTEENNFKKFLISPMGKISVIGIILLVLLIPLYSVKEVISERKNRFLEAEKEVTNSWGNEVIYKGIVFKVPLITTNKDKQHEFIFLYPEESIENVETIVQLKKRGIYTFPVYQAKVKSNVFFRIPEEQENMDLKHVEIGFLTSSDAVVNEIAPIQVRQGSYKIVNNAVLATGINFSSTNPIDLSDFKKELIINSEIRFNGSNRIDIEPLSKKIDLTVKSDWNSPSFSGNLLPTEEKTGKNGFSAHWKYAWNFKSNSGKVNTRTSALNVNHNAIIGFYQPVNHYQLNERTVKYAVLVITLTFAVFFLIELIGRMNLHPIHYLMIGFSLLLFYALVLSLSEQIGFNLAYLLSATSIVTVNVWYARSILGSLRFSLLTGFSLTLLYGFLFLIVNLETYALLVGSVGLFFVLIAIMSFTRRLNFQNQ